MAMSTERYVHVKMAQKMIFLTVSAKCKEIMRLTHTN